MVVLAGLLNKMDADAVAQLRSETERSGVALRTGVKIQRIDRAGDRLRVIYEEAGSEHAIEADRVVNGAGRIADLDGLDLPAGQVAAEREQIALDAHLRSTSNTAVFTCGDAVASSPHLSPIATYERRIVGRNIVDGPKHTPDYASIPPFVFTVPAPAGIGLAQHPAHHPKIAERA